MMGKGAFRCALALIFAGGVLAQAQVGQSPVPQQPGAALPQEPTTPAPQQLGAQAADATAAPEVRGRPDQLRPNYVLRPGDQILIRAFEVEEISERPFKIDGDGFINLPIIGKIMAGGLSVEMLEASLIEVIGVTILADIIDQAHEALLCIEGQ